MMDARRASLSLGFTICIVACGSTVDLGHGDPSTDAGSGTAGSADAGRGGSVGSGGAGGSGGTNATVAKDSGSQADGPTTTCELAPTGKFTFHIHNSGTMPMKLTLGCGAKLPIDLDTPDGTLGTGPG